MDGMELKWRNDTELADLAEQVVRRKSSFVDVTETRDSLVHELAVHQVELRMQNEALIEAQMELRQQRERYKDLFDNAPIGYVVLEPTAVISAANARAAAIFGESVRDIIGTRLTRFLVTSEAIHFERYRREVADSSAPLVTEFTTVSADGRQREVRMESLNADPVTGEWRMILTDVTAHNEMRRKLDHDKRLFAVQRHASTVAHDLNNLLYSVLGHADVALHFLEPTAAAYTPLLRLRDVVNRCAAATERLSTFSRAEEAPQPIVDLHTVTTNLAGALESLLGPDVQLEVEMNAADAAVRLDPSHVEQIILTSARNSRDAMPYGGTYRIETTNVELDAALKRRGMGANRYVRWSMSDTGVGMSESTRNRAFEPFFTTKPPGAGTGLGLAMVKAAIERSGGLVALESALGRGTRLIIYLPRVTGTTSSSRPPSPPDRAACGDAFARVMVVKSESNCVALVDRLDEEGCQVLWSTSSSAALDMLAELGDELTVMLIDDSLPKFVARELVRAVQAVAPRVEVLLGALSPDGKSEGDRQAALDEIVKAVVTAARRSAAQ
jgi:PAS domain S-box-containing protein